MKKVQKSKIFSLAALAVTACLITVTGIVFRQPILHILPLYISLVISLLQSRGSRTAYLIGAGNALLYGAVCWYFRLYASAVYAVLFSCTIQLATYFLWKKRPAGNATVFRRLKPRQRAAVGGGFILVGAVVYAVLSAADSSYRFFDIATSLLGILVSVLAMFAYIEYVPLMIFSQFISIGLYISMMRDAPAQITYLIYTLFSVVCQFAALKRVMSLYKEQMGEKNNETESQL